MKKVFCLPFVLLFAACAAGAVSMRTEAPTQPSAAGGDGKAPLAAPVAAPAEPNGGRSPAFSPDGKRIAFLSSTLNTPPDLWVMGADGSGKRRLTTRGVTSFRWSRDAASILFVARRKGYDEVFSVPVEGEAIENRIPGLPSGSGIPVESPDGKLFAFTAPGGEGVRDLWIGTADRSRVEAVTEKISVRDVFWSPDGRKVYYEAGRSYGVGVWEMDLSIMESRPLVNKYVGTPVYSATAERVAYAYPTGPGEFEVRTMRLDGTDIVSRRAPRLASRWLTWNAEGRALYYLALEVEKAATDNVAESAGGGDTEQTMPHGTSSGGDRQPGGVTSLWRLDLASGVETRISPPEVHLTGFSPSPLGRQVVLSGVFERSPSAELFLLDLISGEMKRLVGARPSAWMPVSSPDATRIAYFTNEGTLATLKVARYTGEEIATYPGFALEGDTRLFWLPGIDGFAVFSARGLFAFSEKGPVAFPNGEDHRGYLYADASIQEDKLLISAIPRYGETPGLYLLAAVDNAFVQTDLRFPPAPEAAADLYLQPRWSMNGAKIAFTDRLDIWTMNADGTGRRRLTDYAEKNREGSGKPSLPSFPVWSVRGERLCYTLTVYDGTKVFREIWVMREDGLERKRVYSEEVESVFQAFLPEYTYPPFFDATDDRLILTGVRDGVPDIFSVEIESGRVRWLTEDGAIYPTLLPEEGMIVYVSLEGNDETLWAMNSDGTGKRPFAATSAPPEGERGAGK